MKPSPPDHARRPYHPDLLKAGGWVEAMDGDGSFEDLCSSAASHIGSADRISVDRWLLIHDRIRRAGWPVPSVLDLGCSSGIFSLLLRLSVSNAVTAVDDGSALRAGYGPESVLDGLRRAMAQHRIEDIECAESSAAEFVGAAADGRRRWDIVLCMGLLHHLMRGYADQPGERKLAADSMESFLAQLGAVTGRMLVIDVDETRVGNPDAFFTTIATCTRLPRMELLGWSCSAPGRPRRLVAFLAGKD